MPNPHYLVHPATTEPISVISGILDAPSVFPPQSETKLIIIPEPGADLLARDFVMGNSNGTSWHLNSFYKNNSHTEWPSRFEWEVTNQHISDNPFYKVVICDSNNPDNLDNWDENSNGNNVLVWVYFGEDENHTIHSSIDLTAFMDIDFEVDGGVEHGQTLTGWPIIP